MEKDVKLLLKKSLNTISDLLVLYRASSKNPNPRFINNGKDIVKEIKEKLSNEENSISV